MGLVELIFFCYYFGNNSLFIFPLNPVQMWIVTGQPECAQSFLIKAKIITLWLWPAGMWSNKMDYFLGTGKNKLTLGSTSLKLVLN